jgi:hypothetical protein
MQRQLVQKIIARTVLPLLMLICVQCVEAQDQPEFKMPCPEVLKLGLNKFMDVYGEKTDDYSTYGQKQAFSYYVDCKRPENDRRAEQLSETRRKDLDAIRNQLNQLGNASWSNAYVAAGGGTMYGLASVGAYAEREDFMTRLISALSPSEKRQPLARRRANTAVVRARRALPSVARIPNLDVWDDESRPEQVKNYRGNVKEIRDAFAQLVTIIGLLPDAAAELVAKQMEAEVSAGLEE